VKKGELHRETKGELHQGQEIGSLGSSRSGRTQPALRSVKQQRSLGQWNRPKGGIGTSKQRRVVAVRQRDLDQSSTGLRHRDLLVGEKGAHMSHETSGRGRGQGDLPPGTTKTDPTTYEPREYEGRENPVGEVGGNEPRVPRGVTRERTATYVRDRAPWKLQANVNKGKTHEDGICTFTVGGRRSYTTLKIEGILDNKSPREIAQALREFGPINFLYFKRSGNLGFSRLGYVNYVFAVNADEAMREFTMKRGNRICFARPCVESMDVLRMNGDDLTIYQVSHTGNDNVILNQHIEHNESWDLLNFGALGNRHEGRR
jgi:hypothetical protein